MGITTSTSTAGAKKKRQRLSKLASSSEDPEHPELEPLMDTGPTISVDGKTFEVRAADFQPISQLRPQHKFGIVKKMRHHPSDTIMAVKRMWHCDTSDENQRLLQELDDCLRSSVCPYILNLYGALVWGENSSGLLETLWHKEVWICMELMDTSADKFYRMIYAKGNRISEGVLGKIAVSVIRGLHFLHYEMKVIHDNVRPSNILISKNGHVKICDFGIINRLKHPDSKAMGSGLYYAPERIQRVRWGMDCRDIRSDVWSLGICMIELATGRFPYANWSTPFEIMHHVIEDNSPQLPTDVFSEEFEDFIDLCIRKTYKERPNLAQLLEHPFIVNSSEEYVDVAAYVTNVLENYETVGTQS